MRVTDKYVFFWDGVFSNWYPSKFVVDGWQFENSEQYFMFEKATYFDDVETASLILEEPNPKKAKILGRGVKHFDEKAWDEVCVDSMMRAITYKFTQNEDLKIELLKYNGKTFVEASPYDKRWGVGLGEDDPLILNKENWKGKNLLGECLTNLCLTLSNKTTYVDLDLNRTIKFYAKMVDIINNHPNMSLERAVDKINHELDNYKQ